jgi:hypothetical protein
MYLWMCPRCGVYTWSSGLISQWIDHMTCEVSWAYRYKVHFGVVVAISLVVTDLVCLHDVSLMYTCVESAYGVEGRALGQRTWHT